MRMLVQQGIEIHGWAFVSHGASKQSWTWVAQSTAAIMRCVQVQANKLHLTEVGASCSTISKPLCEHDFFDERLRYTRLAQAAQQLADLFVA